MWQFELKLLFFYFFCYEIFCSSISTPCKNENKCPSKMRQMNSKWRMVSVVKHCQENPPQIFHWETKKMAGEKGNSAEQKWWIDKCAPGTITECDCGAETHWLDAHSGHMSRQGNCLFVLWWLFCCFIRFCSIFDERKNFVYWNIFFYLKIFRLC